VAVPIAFEPKHIDPTQELQRRLAAAPVQHAEALLVVYDLLEEAHDKGLLDALHGAVHARDAIFGELATGARQEPVIAAIRNVVSLGKILSAMNPEALSCAAAEMEKESKLAEPPTFWQIFRRTRTPEARRGLGLLTSLLVGLGRRS
jgi:uncharacterized protein YjgD (DUF1641 family)